MITKVSIVSVFVKDVDESKRFYTEVLGFDAKDDITLGDGYRWCTVVHPSQPELAINLTVPGPPHSPDLVAAMKRALAEGVECLQPPSERPYGTEALCRDNSGNWLVLVEPATEPFTAEDFEPATSADG